MQSLKEHLLLQFGHEKSTNGIFISESSKDTTLLNFFYYSLFFCFLEKLWENW